MLSMLSEEANYRTVSHAISNSFRRFGRFGPVYQVMGFSRENEQGDLMMKIHIFETNEDLEYPFLSILKDPEESH